MEQMIKIFKNEEFGRVRIVVKNGEPWLVGKDVAKTLKYKETAKAIRMHVDNEDKGVSVLDTPGGRQKITVINESRLYSLVLSSKMPRAKKFRRWVTSEVLPTVRITGGYVANEDMFIENYIPFLNTEYPNFYRQEKLEFELGGEKFEGMAYLMNKGEISPPSYAYYMTILRGYKENGLDESFLQKALDNSLGSEQRIRIEFDEEDIEDLEEDLQLKF